MQWSCKLFFEFQVLLILFLSLVQVQGEYIFKEIESTFALFDRTKRKSSLKVYQSLCRSYTYDIREWNDHSSPERREWSYYLTLIVKLNYFAYECLYIANKSSSNCCKEKLWNWQRNLRHFEDANLA